MGYNTKRIVTDEHLFPTHKPPKKLLRKNFIYKSNEIKLYMLKDESVKEYSNSIDYSSNTLPLVVTIHIVGTQ